MDKQNKHILFCKCNGERIPHSTPGTIMKYLDQKAVRLTVFSDLCGVAAMNRDTLSDVLEDNTEYLVIGCFPRTMRLLFEQAGSGERQNISFNYINLIETPLTNVQDSVDNFCSGSLIVPSRHEINGDSGWSSWYPVIDYSRCTVCGQCADFCLFGVYDKTSEKITVVNPKGCKDQCPACARICPSAAIIFPKYRQGGAVGGSDDIDEKAELQRQARDIESIMGDDIYLALQKRKEKRKSIIKEEEMKKALNERDFALNNKTRTKE
jgi:NAD-dependent dihydropyrimidine dehydrogenase PreA subunit